MKLTSTLFISLGIFFVGSLTAFVVGGEEPGLWFSVGGGLTLINFYFAAWAVRFGFKSLKNKGIFLGLLLMKTMTFLMVIAMILILVKPLLLPFTLGISIVIVGATVAALWESRKILGNGIRSHHI